MKKVKVMFLSLGLMALLSTGACKKEEELSCADATTAATNAGTAFAANPSEATCNALKDALSAGLNACRTGYTQAQIDAAQAQINALDCGAL